MSLRTSSYTIYVDLPNQQDELLLVQTYTGAFDKVSSRVASYLRSLEVGPRPKPLYGKWAEEAAFASKTTEVPSEETLRRLKQRGYLTTLTQEEEEGFLRRFVEKLHATYSRSWPKYLFMPNYDCNLRCPYCFQDHMRTDPSFRRLLKRMSKDMVNRIFTVMPKIEERHGIPETEPRRIDVGFFGGEPLLASNREIVQYIIERAEQRGEAHFWAISNGTELEAYADLLHPERLSSIQITLDGPPDEHDARRKYADGSGSWERIQRNIELCFQRGVSITIRTNVDRSNLPSLVALAETFELLGWHEQPLFKAQVAAIRASNDHTDTTSVLGSWELDRSLAELREKHPVLRILGTVDDPIRQQALRIFSGRGLPALRPSFCSAHLGMYIFDAFGDIYACWERTGDQRIRIGHIDAHDHLQLNARMHDHWRGRTVTTNSVCMKCRYNLHCGGGCAVLAQDNNGDFYRNYCDGYANRFRKAVAEAFLDFSAGKPSIAEAATACGL